MKQQTAADIPTPKADTLQTPRTMPGMMAALVTAEQRVKELEKGAGSLDIALADIDPNPWQPRKVFAADALSELAESIREIGLIEPIVVRQAGERFQLIAGER
jgi:ParB family chromosome partitioning protein